MIQELDTVVLTRDVPEHALKKGDLGRVVLVYELGEAYEMEFLTAHDGGTVAVLTLASADVRRLEDGEILSARRL